MTQPTQPTQPTTRPPSPVLPGTVEAFQTQIQQELSQQQAELLGREESLQQQLQAIPEAEKRVDIGRFFKQFTPSQIKREDDEFNLSDLVPRTFFSLTPEEEAQEKLKNQINQQIAEISQETRQISLRADFAGIIPVAVQSNQINSIEELEEMFGRHLKDPATRKVAVDAFRVTRAQKLRREKPPLTAQESLEQLGSTRRSTIFGVGGLSSTALASLLIDLRGANLIDPIEDIRESLALAGTPSSLAQEFIDEANNFVPNKVLEMDAAELRYLAWQNSVMADIDKGEFDKVLEQHRNGIKPWDNPGLYLSIPWNFLEKHYYKPQGGLLTSLLQQAGGIGGLVGTNQFIDPEAAGNTAVDKFFGIDKKSAEEFNDLFEKHKADGLNGYQAYGAAFDATDTNGFAKFIIEMLGDPTTYIGFGLYPHIFRGVPLLGRSVMLMEKAWMRTWELPFIGIQKGAGLITRTPGAIAAKNSIDNLKIFKKYNDIAEPRGVPYEQMSVSSIKENMRVGLSHLNAHPDSNNEMANASRILLDVPILHPNQARKLAADLGTTFDQPNIFSDEIDVFDILASDTDVIMHRFRMLETLNQSNTKQFVDTIHSLYEVTDTPRSRKIIEDFIKDSREDARVAFNSVLNQNSRKEITTAFLNRRKIVTEANQLNPISKYRSRTAMVMGSLMTNKASRLPLSHIAGAFMLMNKVSYVGSRMYLMSTFYSPFNLLETVVKSMLMNINPGRDKGSKALQGVSTQMELPLLFSQADAFVTQLAPIETTGRMVSARAEGSANRFKRIMKSEANIFVKGFQLTEELFTKTGAGVNLEMNANILYKLVTRWMFEGDATTTIANRVINNDLVGEFRNQLLRSNTMKPEIVEQFTDEALRRVLQDVNSLSSLTDTFTLGHIHAGKVQEIVSKYLTTVGPEMQNYLTDLAIEGRLFPMLLDNSLDQIMKENIMQQTFASSAVALENMRTMVSDVINISADDINTLEFQIRTLEELNDYTGHAVSQQMKAGQAYTRDFTNLRKKNDQWEHIWDNIVFPLMEEGQKSAKIIVDKLKNDLRTKGYNISDLVRNQYDELIQTNLDRIELIIAAREDVQRFTARMLRERDNKETGIMVQISRGGGKPNIDHPRIRDWWERFHTGRSQIWDESEVKIADNAGKMAQQAGDLDARSLPGARDVSSRPLILADVSYLYQSTPDGITNGLYLPHLMMMRPRTDFIGRVHAQAQRVSSQAPGETADSFGYSVERLGQLYDDQIGKMKVSKAVTEYSSPRLAEWNGAREELLALGQSKDLLISDDSVDVIKQAANDLSERIRNDDIAKEVFQPSWVDKRKQSYDRAVQEYNLNFPVYGEDNVVNAGLKFIFPFWTYEAHRLNYLPKTIGQHPGLFHAWGNYQNDTDRGYFNLPGTSLQVNPLRNGVGMGGMFSALNRDFPEFHDQLPALANTLDQLGKYGFYPNALISAGMSSKYANRANIWEVGEIMPPPIATIAETIIAIDPDNAFAREIDEIIMPSGFKDYRTALRVAEQQEEGGNIRGFELLHKKRLGETFTPEEQAIWDRGRRKSSIDSLWFEQVGVFRLRPQELTDYREAVKQTILRYVPITSEQYDQSKKQGYSIGDFYPFPPELKDALNELEGSNQFRGLTTHLQESAVGQTLLTQQSFWRQVEERQTLRQDLRLENDINWKNPGPNHINRRQWEFNNSKFNTETQNFIEDLKESNRYKDIPIDFDDRVKYAQEHNTRAPIQNGLEEIVGYYFGKNPEDFTFFNDEIGQVVTDWDGFFKWRAGIENAAGQEFIERIRKWDTPLQIHRRNDYEKYIRPYKNLWQITLEEFIPEEQILIRKFYATTDANVRAEIQKETIGLEGDLQLVSQFQTTLSERRRRLRIVDPEMDARLVFWGEGPVSFINDTSKQIHDELSIQYGFQP